MLTHQHFESEGAGVDAVNIENQNFFNEDFSHKGEAYAGYIFRASGSSAMKTVTGGEQTIIGEWLLQGDPADYYLRYNITPPGVLDQSDGTENTWIQMNQELAYWVFVIIEGGQTAQVFFEISSDVSGTPIVDTATHSYGVLVGL